MEEDIIESFGDDFKARLGGRQIAALSRRLEDAAANNVRVPAIRVALWNIIAGDADRAGYNLLWAMTYLSPESKKRLLPSPDVMIDTLLVTTHTGKRRLMLNLLESRGFTSEEVRTDFLDYCLSRINSTEPYGIRALCLKLAFIQCRHFPDLLQELQAEIEIMGYSELSPGLRAARKNVVTGIERFNRVEHPVKNSKKQL